MNANKAWQITQNYNRTKWLSLISHKIKSTIAEACSSGRSEVTFEVKDLIIGAENLKEAAELINMTDSWLADKGYDVYVTPYGSIVISWKK